MSRNNTQMMKSIRRMCQIQQVEEKVLYERAKKLLSIYRDVCWATADRADEIREDLVYYCGSELDGALIYLETFAPDEERERFEARIQSLYTTRWMVELIETAMLKVGEYPGSGALYTEILSKCYLSRFKYTESEMLELLRMERSTYYDRKREAVMLFGLAMWGTAIPKMKQYFSDGIA